MNRSFTTIILSGILAGTCIPASAQAPGALSGRVQTADGQPVSGAIVSVATALGSAPQAQSSNAQTAADGTFSVSPLTPGVYQVCVHASRKDLLNPCMWSLNGTLVHSGQVANAGVIQLVAGHLLRVHIADAAKVLATGKGRTPAQIQAGVWSDNGFFLPMKLTAIDSNGRDYELYAPDGGQLQVSVSSPEFDLADESGATIDAVRGSKTGVQLRPGPNAQIVNYRVLGVKNAKKP